MTPGVLNVPVYQGAKYEYVLTIRSGGVVADLTGLSPFTCVISHHKKKDTLITLTVTDTDLVNGQITIMATPEQTDTLPLGFVRLSLRDALGNPYIANTIQVFYFTPDT